MINELLKKKKFIVTAEPTLHDESIEQFVSESKEMKADAYNATDNPGATLAPSPLAASIALKQAGKNPIMQLTCRDRNSLSLMGDLLAAEHFGIKDIMTMTGDHPLKGCKTAKPVYEFDSSTLILLLKGMNEGKNHCGRDLHKKTNFTIGAVISPTITPLEPEIYKTKRKLSAGAEFFQTQPVFSIESIENFCNLYDKEFGEDIRDKIIVGILPIYSTKMLAGIKSLPGLNVNPIYEERIKNAENIEEECTNLSIELKDQLESNSYAGIHVMTFGNVKLHNKIVE